MNLLKSLFFLLVEEIFYPNITNDYISTCHYDAKKDPYCPVFTVETILHTAEPDAAERRKMLRKVNT